MKDPGYDIRKAYFDALSGNITLNGKAVDILDRVPAAKPKPYIVLAEQTANDAKSGKACTLFDTTMLIDIVTGYPLDAGGRKDADLIADQVLQIVIPELDTNYRRTYLPIQGNFQISSARLDSSITLQELSPKELIIRKLLRIRNTVAQK